MSNEFNLEDFKLQNVNTRYGIYDLTAICRWYGNETPYLKNHYNGFLTNTAEIKSINNIYLKPSGETLTDIFNKLGYNSCVCICNSDKITDNKYYAQLGAALHYLKYITKSKFVIGKKPKLKYIKEWLEIRYNMKAKVEENVKDTIPIIDTSIYDEFKDAFNKLSNDYNRLCVENASLNDKLNIIKNKYCLVKKDTAYVNIDEI